MQSGTDLFLEQCCLNKRPNWLSKAECSHLSPPCFAGASSCLKAGCPILPIVPIFPILMLATKASSKKNPHAAVVERPACVQCGRNSDPWIASLYSLNMWTVQRSLRTWCDMTKARVFMFHGYFPLSNPVRIMYRCTLSLSVFSREKAPLAGILTFSINIRFFSVWIYSTERVSFPFCSQWYWKLEINSIIKNPKALFPKAAHILLTFEAGDIWWQIFRSNWAPR